MTLWFAWYLFSDSFVSQPWILSSADSYRPSPPTYRGVWLPAYRKAAWGARRGWWASVEGWNSWREHRRRASVQARCRSGGGGAGRDKCSRLIGCDGVSDGGSAAALAATSGYAARGEKRRAGVTSTITFTTAQNLLRPPVWGHCCSTTASCLILEQRTGEWLWYHLKKQNKNFGYKQLFCTTDCTKLNRVEGAQNTQRLQMKVSTWIHSTALSFTGRGTFSLCFRGGGGLSGPPCRFKSSSIVDFAWDWGECMSLREGLAAGVGTTSPPLSPGDFLKCTNTHTG